MLVPEEPISSPRSLQTKVYQETKELVEAVKSLSKRVTKDLRATLQKVFE